MTAATTEQAAATPSPTERRLRVAFYDHCARMSGAEIALLNTVGAMRDVEPVVVLGEAGPLAAELTAAGVQNVTLPLPTATSSFSRARIGVNPGALLQPVAVFGYAWRLARLLRRIRPDVIVSNSMKSHVILAAARPLLPAPVVFYVHDRVSTDFMSAGGVALERLVMRTAGRGVIANSRSTLDTVPVSRRHRVRPVIGGSIAFPPDDLPEQDPVPAVATRFGMVGRLTAWKGQDLAIRAFAAAFPDGPQTLDVVGGPLFGEEAFEGDLVALVRELGMTERVRLVGHVDDVYARMRGWDCLIHASVIPEPFGQVVAQGMLIGVPVIAADAGGPAEMIEHGSTGWLVPPRDAGALADRLRLVAADPDGRLRVRQAAQLVAEQWLAPTVATRIEAALRDVVAERAR